MRARIVALVMVALCAPACVAPAAGAQGARTIAKAPSIKRGALMRGRLFDRALASGFSVAYWNAPLLKGDRIKIVTNAGADTAPCQILYMPGTDDQNVDGQPPVLEPASATRDGGRDVQKFVATDTGTYVLAMTNQDIFLSSPIQCLSAPSGRLFTFKVTVAPRGSGQTSEKKGGSGERAGGSATYVVEPGQSLWVIAQGLVGEPENIAQVAFKVGRLWELNASRIGSGNPDLIFPGLKLRLR
jgi:nucleoid-associated protein YgaU